MPLYQQGEDKSWCSLALLVEMYALVNVRYTLQIVRVNVEFNRLVDILFSHSDF